MVPPRTSSVVMVCVVAAVGPLTSKVPLALTSTGSAAVVNWLKFDEPLADTFAVVVWLKSPTTSGPSKALTAAVLASTRVPSSTMVGSV